MRLLFRGGRVFAHGELVRQDLFIEDGVISHFPIKYAQRVIDLNNKVILSGFVDVHTHLRQPGFSYKETILSATSAGVAGGYIALCAMPNVVPEPSDLASLQVQLKLIETDAVIPVFPLGCITASQQGERLADIERLSPYVLGFSDDGRGVQDDGIMEQAFVLCAKTGRTIIAHCEQDDLKGGHHIHDGEYAKRIGIKGISAKSEYAQLARDISLVQKTGARYHACHLSCEQSVDLIRQAKAKGLPVTCETAPHYLVLCQDDLCDDGRYKMNPPLRASSDRQALIDGLADGTIDFIATDHAPHTSAEKGRGLIGSLNGIVGLECAFSVLYTSLVKTGHISLSRLIEAISVAPARFVGIDNTISEGNRANLTVVDLDQQYTIDSERFFSLGKSTPFDKCNVSGRVYYTLSAGRIVYEYDGSNGCVFR